VAKSLVLPDRNDDESSWSAFHQRRQTEAVKKKRESRRERLLKLICERRNQKAGEQVTSLEYWPVNNL
jgi:hypothetical protein